MARHVGEKLPLDDRTTHGRDGIFGVGVEVEPNALSPRAIAAVDQFVGQVHLLLDELGADQVVVVETAPARVRVLMAE